MLSRVMMIAGEASGDLHGAGVVRELKKRIPSLEIFGVGGDKMQREGTELVAHISGLSFMGFTEVVKNFSAIRTLARKLETLLKSRRPDVVVLIDYPGFNLRFARRAKRHGIKTLYYISPQVWAWNKRRVKSMKRRVDAMKVVFPFEVDIYKREGINVEFVGHPLAEMLGSTSSREEFYRTHRLDPNKKLLGLFPGSREQEIEKILPTMVRAAMNLQQLRPVQVALGVAPNLGSGLIRRYVPEASAIALIENATYDLMHHADVAIVTSGTATLETGWFGTPMVVVYKTSPLTFLIGRLLVNVANIGLVNIVAGATIVPELVQHQLTTQRLVEAVSRIFDDNTYTHKMKSELHSIRKKLGMPGASARVADGIIALADVA
jgi:lipid-A-disaccharide synthase